MFFSSTRASSSGGALSDVGVGEQVVVTKGVTLALP